MDTVLKTEKLTKKYGEKFAVHEMDMTINRGDIYGFISKNGAGKTTAMRLILGTEFATYGDISLFNGEPLNSARRRIGSLLESPGLYRQCTAKENLRRFSVLTGGTEKDIDNILELVGLSDTGSKKAGAFSLGMRQRLGIGIALLGDPEFMVLDEPVNGLDPDGIKAVRDLVLRLNREKGITFLISSHLLDELAKVVTRYGIIKDGKLIEEITAEELNGKTLGGLTIKADNPESAVNVLKSFASPESIKVEENLITVTDEFENPAEINTALVKAGIAVSEFMPRTGGIEEYFIERMGQ